MGEKNIISEWCLDGSTRKVELCGLLSKSYADSYISTMVEAALKRRVYYNGDGLTEYSDGTKVSYWDAKFVKFNISEKTKDNEPIAGWFSRRNLMNEKFDCIHWGKEDDFANSIVENRRFTIGSMYFDSFEDGYNFIERLSLLMTPETEGGIVFTHDNLKNAMEIKLEQIQHQGVVCGKGFIFSTDGKQVMFNSNLQTKDSQDIFIFGNVDKTNRKIRIHNPQVALTTEIGSFIQGERFITIK